MRFLQDVFDDIALLRLIDGQGAIGFHQRAREVRLGGIEGAVLLPSAYTLYCAAGIGVSRVEVVGQVQVVGIGRAAGDFCK